MALQKPNLFAALFLLFFLRTDGKGAGSVKMTEAAPLSYQIARG
jgi:hypothetical protein